MIQTRFFPSSSLSSSEPLFFNFYFYLLLLFKLFLSYCDRRKGPWSPNQPISIWIRPSSPASMGSASLFRPRQTAPANTLSSPSPHRNKWDHFEPVTNVLWLHYLADKMLKSKSFAVQEKAIEAKMKRFLRQARRYRSAAEMIEDGVFS